MNELRLARARRGDDDLAGRSTTCRCGRLGAAWRAPIRLSRGRSGRKAAAERARQREEKEMRELWAPSC